MLSFKKLHELHSLLHEYAEDCFECGYPGTGSETRNLRDTVAEEIADCLAESEASDGLRAIEREDLRERFEQSEGGK